MIVDTRAVTGDVARLAVLRSLGVAGLPDSAAPGPALCAEALRAALWADWGATARPVYVTRLLNGAERALLPWKETLGQNSLPLSERLRNALQELELIGDLVVIPGGRWVPTPPRFVRLPAISRWLLLGGPPSRLLPEKAAAAIERVGVARMLPRPPAGLALEACELAELEWLRIPGEGLEQWGRAVLERSPLEPAGDLDVEIYAPGAAQAGDTQFHRWTQRNDKLADGRYLARARMRRGTRAYYIVHLSAGRLDTAGAPVLGDGDVRRLQYAIDTLAGRPIRVLAKIHRDHWSFKLKSELPRAEHRLFITIGREHAPPDGSYYPRWWEIPTCYVPIATKALAELGITVDPR